MADRIYVVSKFGYPAIGEVDIEVGLVTNKGVIAETNVGMHHGVVHVVSGIFGTKDSREYTSCLRVESGTLISQTWPTGIACFPFGMSNFSDPRRPSGVYVFNGTNSVPAASYR